MNIKKFNPTIEAQFALVDFKACVKHAIHSGTDENCRYDSITGAEVNTAEHGFRVFLDMYLTHWLEEQDYAPWQILIAHEGGHDYRSSITPDYKANRKPKEGEEPKVGPETVEEYEKLSKALKPFLAYIGCTQLMVKGVEGDDIIAHLHEKLSPRYPCAIYTVDADLLRMADDNTSVWIKKKLVFHRYDSFYDVESAVPKNMHNYLQGLCDEDLNFLPEIKNDIWKHLTLYKSLVGDSSDGYGGVSQFGPAKWTQAVKSFEIEGLEYLEELVDGRKFEEFAEVAQDNPEDKVLQLIFKNKGQWVQSWRLAKLHPELCWKPTKKGLTKITWLKRVPDEARVKKILSDNQCLDYYEDYLEDLMPQKFLIDSETFEEADVQEFSKLCKETPVLGWDYETTAEDLPNGTINIVGSKVNGISFCLGKNFQYAMYLTVNHKDSHNLPLPVVGKFIDAIPEDTATVAHNLAFETVVTMTNLDTVIDHGYDTAVMNSYVDENQQSGLKKCSKRELNYDQETYQDVLNKAGHYEGETLIPAKNMSEVTAEQVMSYGIDDSIVTCHLFVLYWLRMMLEDSWDFYSTYEPTFVKRMALSEVEGVNVDFERLEKILNEDRSTIKTNKDRLREILSEHCSGKLNRKAVMNFIDSDKEFLIASTKHKLSKLDDDKLLDKLESALSYLKKMTEYDEEHEAIFNDLMLEKSIKDEEGELRKSKVVSLLVKLELLKKIEKCLQGSAYYEYVEHVDTPELAPTIKNLTKVCEKLNLEPMESIAAGRLTSWIQAYVGGGFDEDEDLPELTDDQAKFINLLAEARPYFDKSKRGDPIFKEFEQFCCKVLGKTGKVTYSGTELSTSSPIQMQMLFYCMIGMKVRNRSTVQKGSTRDMLGFQGSPSTDSLAVDTALAEDFSEPTTNNLWKSEALTCVKRIKESETRISLYCEAYPKLICPDTGKLHPRIKACGTVTRRPTGSAPNILQVSKHQAEGILRSVYRPIRDNHVIVSIDFAGQELRILASVTKDPNLLSAYLGEAKTKEYLEYIKKSTGWNVSTKDIAYLKDIKDLHTNTGAKIVDIFGLDEKGELLAGAGASVKSGKMAYETFANALSDKSDPYYSLCNKVRKKPAKTSNFLMAYGGSDVSLSQKLIIKLSEGEKIVNAMMELYPGIERAQAEALKFAKTHGYVLTAYGNRRHASDDLFAKENSLVNRQARQLFNSEIQGCAADILKVVIKEAEDAQVWDKCDAVLMAPVYDEIVASVNIDHVKEYINTMIGIMNLLPPGQAVPMMADVSIGPDWQKQIELDDPFPSDERIEEVLKEVVEML